MTWRAVRIAAPQYVIENEDGRILQEHDGKPLIRYSQEQADREVEISNRTEDRQ